MPDKIKPALLIRPASAGDIDAINAIYNEEVLKGTATFDEEPWTREQRRVWLASHDAQTPVLVAEVHSEVAGFAYLSYYRPKSAYRFSREDTIYVATRFQGQGVGRALLEALLGEGRSLGLHAIVAFITTGNVASVELHKRFGFQEVGTEREIGHKFGRWLDVLQMQLLLEQETAPR